MKLMIDTDSAYIDPFYAEKTFQVIASQRNWICEVQSKDIVLLQKTK